MFDPQKISCHVRSQLRRLGFAGTLTVVAALSLYGHLDGRLGPVPAPLAMALFYGTTVVLTGLVTTYFLPRIRRLIEVVALTRLALAACVLAVPEFGPRLAGAPFASATLMVGGAVMLLAAAPSLRALCDAPQAPGALRALAASVNRGALWLDNGADSVGLPQVRRA